MKKLSEAQQKVTDAIKASAQKFTNKTYEEVYPREYDQTQYTKMVYIRAQQGLHLVYARKATIDSLVKMGLIETSGDHDGQSQFVRLVENTDNNNEEEITMKSNQFTFEGSTYYTNEKGNYFYCIKAGKEKADRIPKEIYDEAKELYDAEQDQITVDGTTYTYDTNTHMLSTVDEQAELDESPCYVDPMADLQKPAVLNEFGCVDCSGCRVKPCVHRDCMRRNPKDMGGLAECPRLNNGILGEGQKIAEEEGIEPAEAELEANIRKTKKARKARKSKDVAYEGNSVTLTAKQVDFILHIPDTCFYERGVDSSIWVDVLCDEIGGQFAGKPMTVGAMISTLCEKGLGTRAKDRIDGHKAISFGFTELGKQVAKELGLQ